MNRNFLTGLFAYLIVSSQIGFAEVLIHTAQSAKEVEQYVPHTKNLAKTWMVFDLDDTLLTMKGSLGSVAWWDWQKTLIERNIHSPLRAAKNLNELILVQKKLFETQLVETTDPDYPKILQKAGQSGAALMALTARGDYFKAVTEKQLLKASYKVGDKLIFEPYQPAVLRLKTHQQSFSCPNMFKSMASQKGIMYLANQSKGEALTCILNRSKVLPEILVFVDDSPSNIQSVADALRKYPHIHAHLVLFTKEHAKEAAFKSSKCLQKQAALHWEHLQQAFA